MEKEERHNPENLLKRSDAAPSMFIGDISRLFHKRVRRETERDGISDGCRKLLMELCHEDGVTQLTLVKLTRLSAPTVSVALAKMEADGFVERRTDKEDLRQTRVFITEKGRERDRTIQKKCQETEEIMLSGFSEDERKDFIRLLRKTLENLVDEEGKKQ